MAVRHDAHPTALVAARARELAKPGREKMAGRGSGLTPKVRRAVDLLIFGDGEGKAYPTEQDAAAAAGLTVRSFREAMLKPAVMAYHQQQMVARRHGLKVKGLNVLDDVMTNEDLRKTAAGNNVRVNAAKVLLVEPSGPQVNVQLNNNVTITPGYVLDLRPEPGTPNAPVIDHDEIITPEG